MALRDVLLAARRAVRRRRVPAAPQRRAPYRPRCGNPCRELRAGDLAQIVVDVFGRRLAGALPSASTYWNSTWPGRSWHRFTVRARRPSCSSISCQTPLLARKRNLRRSALHRDVPVAQRRQAERLVGARVFLVADPDQRGFEQPHDGGQHAVARERRRLQVAHDAPAQRRQRPSERQQAAVLGRVAHLLASAGGSDTACVRAVAAGGLHVAIGARADPHARPGRRNHQRANARKRRCVANHTPVGIAIDVRLPRLSRVMPGSSSDT